VPCSVDIAASGEEALTKLTYNRYDLLVTDLKMPGITGFTLVEVARSLDPDLHVILMTAFGSPEVQKEVELLRVDGYLTKPFPTAQLRDMVCHALTSQDKPLPNLMTQQDYLPVPLQTEGQEG
jgi:CheY-like chemotaxis protein